MAKTDRTRKKGPPFAIRLAIHWLTNALLLAILVAVLKHVSVNDAGALFEAAAVFGVLNTVLKPILRLMTFPLAILTLGISKFFVALLMLVLTRAIVSGFHVHGFTTFVEATVIIWVVNLTLDILPGPWKLAEKK
jgi:putative membrane protein